MKVNDNDNNNEKAKTVSASHALSTVLMLTALKIIVY